MAATGSNSRLAVTCGLLRQYMLTEQQLVEAADSQTMQLFPTRPVTASQPSHDHHQPLEAQANKAALTIFYEGRVLVFEDFPADKAEELMQLARSGSEKPAPATSEPSAVPSNLPIARKASLQRFLQKRKERIGAATEPYMKAKVAASPAPEKDFPATGNRKQVMMTLKEEPAASWLRL